MRIRFLAIALTAAVASTGCFEFLSQSTTNPSPSIQMLGSRWTSEGGNAAALLSSCTNFVWNVTEQSSSNVAGSFSATCFNVLQVSGTASGTISGSAINWSANGTATGGGLSDCPVALSGTALISTNQIQVPYSGTTCMGPVSGTEVLTKKP